MHKLVISALIYCLCFPLAVYSDPILAEWASSLLVWFAWVPVLLALDFNRPKSCFTRGYAFGAIFNSLILWWIIIAMRKYGGMSIFLSGGILALLVLLLSLYPAVLFYIVAKMGVRSNARVWAGAATLALLEWTRTFFPLGGFPWVSPAYGLHGNLYLIQSLDVIGVVGLNFLLAFFSFLTAETLRREVDPKRLRPSWVAFFLFLGLTFIYGVIRLRAETLRHSLEKPIRTSLVQGNISQDQKWSLEARDRILKTYRDMSSEAIEKYRPQLIIWPEASIPFASHKNIAKAPFSTDFLSPGSFLLFGSATYEHKNNRRVYLNSAFLSDSEGGILRRYDKQKLVPFGEYVPFENIISWMVPAVAGNFSRGTASVVFPLHEGSFAVLICYESLFSDISRSMVKEGAEFFVNITNDAWFDHTSGPFQHAQFAKFRAIETRRSIVRSANTGISYEILPSGRVLRPTRLFEPAVTDASVYPRNTLTFYVMFPWLMPLLSFLILGVALFKKRKERS